MKPSDKFCLSWRDYHQNFTRTFQHMRNQSEHFDVSLAVEHGEVVLAHKLVLCAGSHLFRQMFSCQQQQQHQFIFLPRAKLVAVQAVLDFMYLGTVAVNQQDLGNFLNLAEELQVKGLTPHESESDAVDENYSDMVAAATLANAAQSASTYKQERVDEKSCEAAMTASVRAELATAAVSINMDSDDKSVRSAAASTFSIPVPDFASHPADVYRRPAGGPASSEEFQPIDSNDGFKTAVVTNALPSADNDGDHLSASTANTKINPRRRRHTALSSVVSTVSLGSPTPVKVPRRNGGHSPETLSTSEAVAMAIKAELSGKAATEAAMMDLNSTTSRKSPKEARRKKFSVILANLSEELSKLTQGLVLEIAEGEGKGSRWRCYRCHQLFATIDGCQLHVESAHLAAKGGVCPVCIQRFPTIGAVMRHVVRAHKDKLQEEEEGGGSNSSDEIEIIN